MSIIVTLAPLMLGLTAWTLNLLYTIRRKRHSPLCMLSWCLCACALWFPLLSWDRWAQNEDVAALLDCAHAYCLCAGILLIGNLHLTALGWLRSARK